VLSGQRNRCAATDSANRGRHHHQLGRSHDGCRPQVGHWLVGGDGAVRDGASSIVVTNVCLSMCRSIRTPRLFSRSGPAGCSSAARSTARLTAGGSGTRTTFLPLPRTRRDPVPVLLAEVVDVRGDRLEDL